MLFVGCFLVSCFFGLLVVLELRFIRKLCEMASESRRCNRLSWIMAAMFYLGGAVILASLKVLFENFVGLSTTNAYLSLFPLLVCYLYAIFEQIVSLVARRMIVEVMNGK